MKNKDFFDNISKELHPKSKLFLSADLTRSSDQKQPTSSSPEFSDLTSRGLKEEEIAFDPILRSMQAYLDDRWFSFLTEFYQKFHLIFVSEVDILLEADQLYSESEKHTVKCEKLDSKRLVVWKLAGDEIVYAVDTYSEEEIYLISLAFVRSIIIYRKILYDDIDFFHTSKGREFKHYRDQFSALYSDCILDVKGTIWWAGFPISNRELVLSEDLRVLEEALQSTDPRYRNLLILKEAIDRGVYTNSTAIVDYLGPSIDIGFRLSSLSNSSQLPVSVEVAYLINKCEPQWTSAITESTNTRKSLDLTFSGRKPLKGVFGSKPYPVFWLDSSSKEGLTSIEKKMLGGNGEMNRDDLEEYFRRVFQRHSRFLNKPEIIDMDKEYDESSIICNVISRIDEAWCQEQAKIRGRLAIYSTRED